MYKKAKNGQWRWTRAVLDVAAEAHCSLPDHWLDVTVRHPLAASALQATCENAGAVLEQAEEDKAKRYPPRGGMRVTPCAMACTGALGGEMEALLAKLAAAVQSQRACEGLPGRWVMKSWRAALSRALARWTGQTILLSRRDTQACAEA